MQKIIFTLSLLCFLNIAPVYATDTQVAEPEGSAAAAEGNHADTTVHIGYEQLVEIKKMSLTPEEDDLYADTTLAPLNKEMSDEERGEKDITIFQNTEKQRNFELKCDNPMLKQQVINFIYQKINTNETHSVPEKRLRALLVKNVRDFKEIRSDKLSDKNAFNARAVVMELRVNKHFPLQKICESKGNEFNKFESIYIVMYEDEGYYKIIVTNLMSSPNKSDDATFIFNWQ